ncbi:hypothetical protein DFP72DRAFT_838498 [Ephemerocybe angulata]|uniref:Uncharacterized protein n=1 Tax=Ephemerocybe angulata TaxID=980116 RepID=A0A8H6IJX3_9AGAR|nr:hypothetical protein DFP72DRAFT_838498 [Tulosesus angulatus]
MASDSPQSSYERPQTSFHSSSQLTEQQHSALNSGSWADCVNYFSPLSSPPPLQDISSESSNELLSALSPLPSSHTTTDTGASDLLLQPDYGPFTLQPPLQPWSDLLPLEVFIVEQEGPLRSPFEKRALGVKSQARMLSILYLKWNLNKNANTLSFALLL